MKRVLAALTNGFALWVVLGTAWAWFFPDHFKWFVDDSNRIFGVKLIHLGLGLIMFGMGITLSFDDFRAVLKIPGTVVAGVAAQFVVMPLMGFLLAKTFSLETGLAVGLILVSCCPGGTASNVVTYLARANLPLSVLMTMCSTLAAVVMTPLLTGWLAGKYVDIDRWNLFLNMIAVVLVPVLVGVSLNRVMPKMVRYVTPWSPVMSVVIIVLIVGGIIGVAKDKIIEHAGDLLLVVFLLHAAGFAIGYLLAALFGFEKAFRRTLSIEVGMQNSGLGSSLAKTDKFQAQFGASPEALMQASLAPVPSAVSALYHCVIGSMLAAYWRRSTGEEIGLTMESRLARVAIAIAGGLLAFSGWPVFGVLLALMAFNSWTWDKVSNRVARMPKEDLPASAKELHSGAFVADLHADVCAWHRDLMRHNRRGHVDLPRLREGEVALQFVTVPTKLVLTKRAPRLFFADLFFWGFLGLVERPDRWFSTAARARWQVERFERWIGRADGALLMVRDQGDLADLRRRRREGEPVIGVMLGLEGAHALLGRLDVPWLAEKGFRVLGIAHFNDTRYGDSAHGWRKRGLTRAGRDLVKELEAHAITIDLAHASAAVIDDVLAMCDGGELTRPLIVSHTGVKGVHDHRRNIADAQAVEIARRGGLIGVTFFEPALPRLEIAAVVETVRYVIELFDQAGLDGARHVALGSDFDGAVKTVIDVSGWPLITAALLEVGLSQAQVKLVIGENVGRFFAQNLPAAK